MNANAPRRIAVVPAYNEEPTVAAVLDELYPLVDELVVVDDGSTDGTRAEIERWMEPGRPHFRLLVHEVNQGMSEAYYTALTELRDRLRAGELDADDLVFTVDADGQHDVQVLDALVETTRAERLDANIARRDLSYHGPFKRFGNWVLSRWASAWAGSPLYDVESGYRIFRLGALAHALEFYSGYKYSETVEVAVVLCQLGYTVRNDQLVPVPVARSRTRMRDAVIDLAAIPVAASRVWRGDRARQAFRTDAVAHLSIAAVVGVLIALTYSRATDTVFAIAMSSLAAFGLGGLLRRSVPRPSLALLGSLFALVAAWLVPQRPDTTSAIVLSGVFGVGAALAAPGVRRPRPSVIGATSVALILASVVASRGVVLTVSVALVFVAALVSRAGQLGLPRTHRVRTLALGSTLVVAVSGLTGYFGASTVGATWFGGGVVHGPRTSDEVALTFDTAPDTAETAQIVKILDDAHVKASFFVVGKSLDESPDIVRRLVRDGHLVGNHAYHYDEWRWLDPRYPELERSQRAFAKEIGTCPIWFRPPFGQRTPLMARVVKDHGMRMAMWDVSVTDRRGGDDANAIAEKVLAQARGGSIIDLQAGIDRGTAAHRAALVAALPLILDGLAARNLRPVRLDQLVGGPAYQSCDRAHT